MYVLYCTVRWCEVQANPGEAATATKAAKASTATRERNKSRKTNVNKNPQNRPPSILKMHDFYYMHYVRHRHYTHCLELHCIRYIDCMRYIHFICITYMALHLCGMIVHHIQSHRNALHITSGKADIVLHYIHCIHGMHGREKRKTKR